MMVGGWKCMMFFTNLSNIFVGIASAIMIPFNVKNLKNGSNSFPKWLFILKFTATVSVTVTLLTVVFFLGPMNVIMGYGQSGELEIARYFNYFAGNAFYLHFLTPILAIASVIFFENCEVPLSKKTALWGLLPTVLYSIVYFYEVVIVGWQNGGWYDFYGFTFGGNMKLAAVSIVAMYAATYLISRIELWAHNKIFK